MATSSLSFFLLWSLLHTATSNIPPKFIGLSSSYFVEETKPVGYELDIIQAEDVDDQSVVFSIEGEIAQQIIEIDQIEPKKARVLLKMQLDRETIDSYTLVFQVTDGVNVIHKVTQLFVTDVNDNAPTFINLPYRVNLPENTPVGETVFQIQAQDVDSGIGGLVSYNFSPRRKTTHEVFSLDGTTGELILDVPLDYEVDKFYQLEVMAQDGYGLNSTTLIIINIKDTQDTAPFFLNRPYISSVQEDMAVGSSIMQVTALDGDTGAPNPIQYSFISGQSSYFTIDPTEGIISVGKALDREAASIREFLGVLEFTIQAEEITSDPQGPIKSTASVTINIIDVNDQHPSFNMDSYVAVVAENTQLHVPISFVPDDSEMSVTDYDQGDNGRFELFLEKDNESFDVFEVVPQRVLNVASILLRVKNASALNYELQPSYTFEIVAREYATTEMFESRADVTVNIQDLNDNWPIFTKDSYFAAVAENSALGTPVTTIKALDGDSGVFGEISYNLRGATASLFEIDSQTGEIRVAVSADLDHSLLDRETKDTHYLTIEAVDGGGLRSSAQLEIQLQDVNDNPPTITRSSYDGFVTENNNQLENTLVIQALDVDYGDNSLITMAILPGPNSEHFEINSATGEIQMITAIDYEALEPSLSGIVDLTIMAKDGGDPSLNSTVVVHIIVHDANDEVPEFEQLSYDSELPEDAVEGTSVITVEASDADKTSPNNDILYRIESGARDKFRIDATSGLISVESGANLDHDINGKEYVMSVVAIDRGTPPNTGTTNVKVTITDVNNKPPTFDPQMMTVTKSEGLPVGDVVVAYTAMDPDESAVLSYMILEDLISGTDPENQAITDLDYLKGLFGIYENNGTVYVKSKLNREEAEEIVLIIQATDTMAPNPTMQTGTAELTIQLQDVNDNPPQFVPSATYTAKISEASPVGTEVKQVSAVDPDATTASIKYYVEDNNDGASYFEITDSNREVGMITLKKEIDREMFEVVELEIRVEDDGNPANVGMGKVIIEIGDINDNSPAWVDFPSDVSVYENAPIGSSVVEVMAEDADLGEYGAVTYHITGGDDGKFTINPKTGLISVNEMLDREVESSYSLTIEARDNPNGTFAQQRKTPGRLEINLLDVNDFTPQFEQESYIVRDIQESALVGASVMTIRTTDLDEGLNSEVIYEIDPDQGNGNDLFDVDQDSGVIFIESSLRGTVGVYYIVVIATDKGTPPLSNQTIVYITVVDVNDNRPRITHPADDATITVPENQDAGYQVVRVRAEDDDEGVNGEVRFAFVMNPSNINEDWLKFYINETTGVITTTQALDREAQEYYFLEVQAYDMGVPSYDDRRNFKVLAIDQNDNPPQFDRMLHPTPYIMSVMEEQEPASVGFLDIATDPDSGNNSVICYFIVGGDPIYKSYFSLTRDTGSLNLVQSLDHEVVQSVLLVVQAAETCWDEKWDDSENQNITWDETDPSLMLVKVDVIDTNDNKPVFTKSTFSAGVSRDTQFGEKVIDFSDYVVDFDSPDNQNHQFYIVSRIDMTETLPQTADFQSEASDTSSNAEFIIGKEDGVLLTNTYFQQDTQGYFTFTVKVNDSSPNHSSTATASIYLLNEEQRAKVIIRGTPEEVGLFKDVFADYLSNITGHTINVDKIQTHEDSSGIPDERKVDMFIHAIDPDTGQVLGATQLIDLVDQNYLSLDLLFKQYNVIEIVPAVAVATSNELEDNLQLILILLAAILLVILIISCAIFLTCRKKYKRKLKAATAMAFGSNSAALNHNDMPGTNLHMYEGSNPIWLEQTGTLDNNGWAKDYDNDSLPLPHDDSLDENAMEATFHNSANPMYDEQELTIDMHREDFDHYNRVTSRPQIMNSEFYTKRQSLKSNGKVSNGATKTTKPNNLNQPAKNPVSNGGPYIHAYDNLAFSPNMTTRTVEGLQTTDI